MRFKVVDDVEHGCCHEVSIVDTEDFDPIFKSIDGYAGTMVAEFRDENLAIKVCSAMNSGVEMGEKW